MNTYCDNAGKKCGDEYKDENGKKFIICRKTGEKCIAQRYCGELQEYIVSEHANRYCKNFTL